MFRPLLLLALCVSPAIAIECDKCTNKECFGFCYLRQKTLTAEAQAKCGDGGGNNEDWKAKHDALKADYDDTVAALTVCRATTTTTEPPSPFKPLADRNIQQAVNDWLTGGTAKEEVKAIYGPIQEWDTSGVTYMSGLFAGADSFNDDIGDWDVSAVTNMNGMFYSFYGSTFNQDIGEWDVSAVADMSWMMMKAEAFNQDIGDWDVAAVTDMNHMFAYAYDFNQDIGEWDLAASPLNLRLMFFRAYDFNQDIGEWDVSAVVYMDRMFEAAFSFNQNIGD